MAYRRSSRSRTRTASRRKSPNRSASRSRRNPRVRRTASASRQTLRIVIEQPGTSAVARPNFGQAETPTKKAKF